MTHHISPNFGRKDAVQWNVDTIRYFVDVWFALCSYACVIFLLFFFCFALI
jgi:hypothetical protein